MQITESCVNDPARISVAGMLHKSAGAEGTAASTGPAGQNLDSLGDDSSSDESSKQAAASLVLPSKRVRIPAPPR